MPGGLSRPPERSRDHMRLRVVLAGDLLVRDDALGHAISPARVQPTRLLQPYDQMPVAARWTEAHLIRNFRWLERGV